MKVKFTKPALEGLKPRDGPYIVWDEGYPYEGSILGARVATSGDISIFVQYRVNGKQSKKTLYKLRRFLASGASVSDLRKEAAAFVDAAQDLGLTTTEAKEAERAERQAEEERTKTEEAERQVRAAAEKTITEFGEEFIRRRMAGEILKPYADGGRQMRLAVERAAEVWGDKPLTNLRMEDGSALLNRVVEVTKTARYKNGSPKARGKYPGYQAAVSTRGVLIPLLTYAADQLPDIRTNIFKLWTPKINGPRRAVMTKSERVAFFEALEAFEQPQSNRTGRRHNVSQDTADILRLTYLCAARKSDWVQAQWKDVDLEKAFWVRPEHKRKQGTEHKQILTKGVVDILKRIRERRAQQNRPHGDDDFIFPSVTKTGKRHRTSVWDAFQTITKDLNVGKTEEERITPHTLRASRITEWRDEHGWSFQKIARVMGNTADMVEKVYYRPRDDAEELRGGIEVDSDADLPI